MEQQTIGGEAALEGVGLHTGSAARLRFLAADPNTGVRFRRTDLDGAPEIPASLDSVQATDRNTTLGVEGASVATVEHLLAAVGACELDNLVIEIDGPEVPIGDGSFAPFFDALRSAGTSNRASRRGCWS
jgi:UDP-3-O-[3-hydroxymyristoyl] N-acetylglucosamine deacetylase / 3-hydroxyacyl-[acyl-carrier-protein] dehydratase